MSPGAIHELPSATRSAPVTNAVSFAVMKGGAWGRRLERCEGPAPGVMTREVGIPGDPAEWAAAEGRVAAGSGLVLH
jgi:hypothetical protein